MGYVFLVVMGIVVLNMLLVVYGTAVKNRFGVNLTPVTCPSCNSSMPSPRTPQNMRQYLWGGGYCPNCGAEVDKWGRLLSPPMAGRPQLPPPTEYSMTRSVILMSVVGFGVGLFLKLLAVERPLLLAHWIVLIAGALFDAVVLAVILAFVFRFITKRYLSREP